MTGINIPARFLSSFCGHVKSATSQTYFTLQDNPLYASSVSGPQIFAWSWQLAKTCRHNHALPPTPSDATLSFREARSICRNNPTHPFLAPRAGERWGLVCDTLCCNLECLQCTVQPQGELLLLLSRLKFRGRRGACQTCHNREGYPMCFVNLWIPHLGGMARYKYKNTLIFSHTALHCK